MVKALFDSSILIDYFKAIPAAREEMQRYANPAISIVSWIEVLVGAPPERDLETQAVLRSMSLIALDEEIAQRAVELRRAHRIKLPDAIIWASAQIHGMLLITRDTKDFPANDPGIRHPYTL